MSLPELQAWSGDHIFRLARKVAQSNARKFNLDKDELTQDIAERLLMAHKRYDASKGVPLGAYMNMQVPFAIKSSLRAGFVINSRKYNKKRNGPKIIFEEYDTTEEVNEEGFGSNIFGMAAKWDSLQYWDEIKHIFSVLSDMEKKIMFLWCFGEYSAREIGWILGKSEYVIYQKREVAEIKCLKKIMALYFQPLAA